MRDHGWGPEAETLAAEVLDATAYDPEEDPFRILRRLGLTLLEAPAGTRPTVIDRTVLIDGSERPERQRFAAVHEALHVVRRAQGEPDPDALIDLATCAVLCPRADSLRCLRRLGPAPELWAGAFPWTSHETRARRIVALRPSVLWVVDVAPRRRRYLVTTPGWNWPHRSPTPVEREALETAIASRCPVEPVGGVRAWTVEDGAHLRAFCLSDPEALGENSFRLA